MPLETTYKSLMERMEKQALERLRREVNAAFDPLVGYIGDIEFSVQNATTGASLVAELKARALKHCLPRYVEAEIIALIDSAQCERSNSERLYELVEQLAGCCRAALDERGGLLEATVSQIKSALGAVQQYEDGE